MTGLLLASTLAANRRRRRSSRSRQYHQSRTTTTRRKAASFLLLYVVSILVLSTIPFILAEERNNNDDDTIQKDSTNHPNNNNNNNSPSSSDSSSPSSKLSKSAVVVRIANGPAPLLSHVNKIRNDDDDDDDDDDGSRVMQRYDDNGDHHHRRRRRHRPSTIPSRIIPNNDNNDIAATTTTTSPTTPKNNNKIDATKLSSSIYHPSEKQQQQQQNDNDTNNNSFLSQRVHQSFQTLFTPQIEEYTLTKFDPYSFSGAPMGGWGRATRSRLASLPIRLVSDYGGGFDLRRPSTEEVFWSACDKFGVYSHVAKNGGEDNDNNNHDDDDDDGEWMCLLTKDQLRKLETIEEYFNVWGMTDEIFHQVWSAAAKEVIIVGNKNDHHHHHHPTTIEKDQKIGLVGFLQIFEQFDALYMDGEEDPWESTGPHFTFRDGMGRQFVCRAYDEGELVIDNYMDSMFNPAVRVGYANAIVSEKDEEWGGKANNNDDDGSRGKKKEKKRNVEDVIIPGVEDVSIGVETFIVHDGGVDENNVAEAISSSVLKLFEKMGIALNGQHNGEDIVVEAVVDNNDIADIVKFAIQGAGINKGDAAAAIDKKDSTPPPPQPPNNSKPLSTQLTTDQIINALKELRGFCSQLHLGWWSYEWCHEYQVRQFHVDVSADPTAVDGRKYEIQDVTTIGHYQGKTEIINPRGIYDGEVKKGSSTTYILDDTGKVRQFSSMVHGPKEDEEYSQPFYDVGQDMKSVMSPRLRNELQKYKIAQQQKLGNSGGIVRQQFLHGDMCDEVGILRQVSVEYRCCTEDEISHWLTTKRKATDSNSDGVPLAALVSVQEDETCVYRAKVCTPVLCPESLTQEEAASSPVPPGKRAHQQGTTNDDNQVGAELGQKDAIQAVFRSLNEEGGVTQVKIFMGSDDIAESLNELIQAAQNGEDFSKSEIFKKVIEAMDLGKQERGQVVQPESIVDGKSIREVLQSTLGLRPCLMKNLGWWTYEFCHGAIIRQYHANNLIDPKTGAQQMQIESEHLLGKYTDALNYSNEDEHLHVVNVTGISADIDIGRRNKRGVLNIGNGGGNQNEKGPGGNGAVFIQEYMHGDVCDHEDVAESVIKGGNIVHGSVERSSTVRFSCGKNLELVDIKEDSTCHYIIDVAVPALCNHPLFMAPVTKTQVVKCLPV